MTRVLYEPGKPALTFSGHAGAGEYGHDLVCAALSILQYTLREALPEASVQGGEGYCRVEGGDPAPYAYTAGGVRLLAESFPNNVRMEVRT